MGHPPPRLVLEFPRELDDQALLPLGAKRRFHVTHNPGAATDRDPLANLERLLATGMSSGAATR